ncbi:unnamed protein product [Choristocarpus tenellus]
MFKYDGDDKDNDITGSDMDWGNAVRRKNSEISVSERVPGEDGAGVSTVRKKPDRVAGPLLEQDLSVREVKVAHV